MKSLFMEVFESLTTPLNIIFRHRMSQFIIGLNKYLESVNNGFKVGMRFKMRFEGEDTPERRYIFSFLGSFM